MEVKILKIYYTTFWTVLQVSFNQEKQQSVPYHALSPSPFVEHTLKSGICLIKIRFCLYLMFS